MDAPARTIRLRLAYEGTRYSGWQAQPGRETVQGTLAEAIRKVSGEAIVPKGSSRTDAGVHAMDQVVAFQTASLLAPDVWVRALNAWLPPDITVTAGDIAPDGFDPVSAPTSKRYRYRIHDAVPKPVLTRPFVWRWRSLLNVEAMQAAAPALVGEHDFTSFETTPSTRLSKVRTIFSLSVERMAVPGSGPGDEVWIEVAGNGFLYNMVRIIAGSLVMVGAGRRSPEWLGQALAARNRPVAGPTAPPQGLCLIAIHIPPDPPASSTSDAKTAP